MGAADLAGSGAAPMGLVGPPNCGPACTVCAGGGAAACGSVGTCVGTAADVAVGSWKLEENAGLAVVAVEAEKLKMDGVEDTVGAKKPPPGTAGCCAAAAVVKRPPPVVGAAAVEAGAGVGAGPKLKVPPGCDAMAVPKLNPPPAPALPPPPAAVVVVGRVGKLNPLPPPVVLGADPLGGKEGKDINTKEYI